MTRVELVSHGPPGSGPSRMLAALADGIREATGSSDIRLADRPANDGAEAIETLARRRGDGWVAGSCTPTYFTTPIKRHLKITYRDLTPLGQLVADTYLLVIRCDAPWTSAAELFAHDSVAAVAPRGGNTHIQALLIGRATSRSVALQFHGRLSDATDAVAAGQADWTSGVITDFRPAIEAGRLRILTSLAAADEASTTDRLTDQGIPVAFGLWRGLIGPGGLELKQIRRWERWLDQARATPAWSRYLTESGVRDAPSTARDFRALLDHEAPLYAEWLGQLERA